MADERKIHKNSHNLNETLLLFNLAFFFLLFQFLSTSKISNIFSVYIISYLHKESSQ